MAANESSLRIEITVRVAMIAKAALDMLGMEPSLVLLQLREVVQQVQGLETAVRSHKVKPGGATR